MKHKELIGIGMLLSAMISCTNSRNDCTAFHTKSEPVIYAKYCTNYCTKTTMFDEAFGDIYWNPSDSINVYKGVEVGCGEKYVNESSEPCAIAEFKPSRELSEDNAQRNFTAIYPYDEDNIFDGTKIQSKLPAEQMGYKANFDPKVLIAAGNSETNTIGFYNVCGGIRISVSETGIKKVVFRGNDNEILAGKIYVSINNAGIPEVLADKSEGEISITLEIPEAMESGEENYYYITMIPQTLEKGFNMTFYKYDEESVEEIKTNCDATVTIKRGMFSTVHMADDQESVDKIMNAEDLSIGETSNCYIINEPGSYKFRATKGNTDYTFENISSAEVLWETDNTADVIDEGSLITMCFLNNSYIYFKTPSELCNGNALIVLKDYSGDIVWSWHIWICENFNPETSVHKYKGCSSSFMDRNLGALSSERKNVLSNGLYYQWGRKDPFPGAVSRSENDGMMATTKKIELVMSDESTGNVIYAIMHPDTFIWSDQVPFDWNFIKRDNELWKDSKGLYDPCPAGWKVPISVAGQEVSWSGVVENNCRYETMTPGLSILLETGDEEYAFYPANGYLKVSNDKLILKSVGELGRYWSCSTDTQTATVFEIVMGDGTIKNSMNISKGGIPRYEGRPVRCVKDEK